MLDSGDKERWPVGSFRIIIGVEEALVTPVRKKDTSLDKWGVIWVNKERGVLLLEVCEGGIGIRIDEEMRCSVDDFGVNTGMVS